MSYSARILTTANAVILDLSTTNGYWLVDLVVPQQVRRRDVVVSPDMAGEVERQSVLDAAVVEMRVSCRAANASAAWTLYDNLWDAVNGDVRRFRLETTIHGRVEKWEAYRASAWRLDTDPDRMALHLRDVSLTVPVFPVAV